jgi:two-component system alkaline phosphatase synthesis response regulator PhoP
MTDELVLVVDDEPNIVELQRLYLEREGFRIDSAGDGPAALEAAARLHPALIILDIMLPGMDGLEVCRKLRTANDPVPILMVTARDEDIDKIIGLEMGADDYLTKPFNPRELVARVKAILRRSERLATASTGTVPLQVGDLSLDPVRREVRVKDHLVDIRTQEFEVLQVLMQHPGWVLSRDQLLNLAWGFDFAGQTRTVDVHIGQLRRRLALSRVRIETVTGVGYKLVA